MEIIHNHSRLLLHPALGEPHQGETQDSSPHDHSPSCRSDTIWTVPLQYTVSCRVSLVTLAVLLSSSGEYSVHRPLSSRGRGQRVSWLSLVERVRWPVAGQRFSSAGRDHCTNRLLWRSSTAVELWVGLRGGFQIIYKCRTFSTGLATKSYLLPLEACNCYFLASLTHDGSESYWTPILYQAYSPLWRYSHINPRISSHYSLLLGLFCSICFLGGDVLRKLISNAGNNEESWPLANM